MVLNQGHCNADRWNKDSKAVSLWGQRWVILFPMHYKDPLNIAVLASLRSNSTLLRRCYHLLANPIVYIIPPILLVLTSSELAAVKEQAHRCKNSPCQILYISLGIRVPLGRPLCTSLNTTSPDPTCQGRSSGSQLWGFSK